MEEVYINKLKDGTTFFHKVYACDLLEHLKKNSTGLHALDIVALCLNMLLLYKKCCKHAWLHPGQGRSTEESDAHRAPHPWHQIGHVRRHLHSPIRQLQEGNQQIGRTECLNETWSKWKQAYLAAYARGVNCQCAGVTDKPFSQAANLVMLPAAHDVIDALAGWLLDNLALVAARNRTTVQQSTLANLSLTTSVATLMAANKKLSKMVAQCNLVPQRCSGRRGCGSNSAHHGPKAIRGNYC